MPTPVTRKPIVILIALYQEQEVKIGDEIYSLMQDEHSFPVIAMKRQRSGDGGKTWQEAWLNADLPLNVFLNMCEKMPEDRYKELAANTAFNNIKAEKYGKQTQ